MNAYRSLAIILSIVIFALVFNLVPLVTWLVTKLAEALALLIYRISHLAAIEYRAPSGQVVDVGAILLIIVLVGAALKFLFGRRG